MLPRRWWSWWRWGHFASRTFTVRRSSSSVSHDDVHLVKFPSFLLVDFPIARKQRDFCLVVNIPKQSSLLQRCFFHLVLRQTQESPTSGRSFHKIGKESPQRSSCRTSVLSKRSLYLIHSYQNPCVLWSPVYCSTWKSVNVPSSLPGKRYELPCLDISFKLLRSSQFRFFIGEGALYDSSIVPRTSMDWFSMFVP